MVDIQTEEMSSLPEPNIMVVDDDSHVGKSIGRLLTLEGISHEIFENPRDALAVLEKNRTVFWLIISDQRMPEMKGTVFLEKAKAISPETVCFLITAYTDIGAIMDSVNKGTVTKYILKPWDDGTLLRNIKSALKKFQATIENKILLEKAVDQTKQLYGLGIKLMTTITRQKKMIGTLTKESEMLSAGMEHSRFSTNQLNETEQIIKEKLLPGGKTDMTALVQEYRIFVRQLYSEFEDLAGRNGFSIPDLGTHDIQN